MIDWVIQGERKRVRVSEEWEQTLTLSLSKGALLGHDSVGPTFAHAVPKAQSITIEVGHPFLL